MYCAQNNRIFCSDCNKSYTPNNYSNQLKSKAHINAKKKCCSNFDTAITQDNNHNSTCCLDNLSLKLDDNMKIDFTYNQNNQKKHTKTKKPIDNLDRSVSKVINIDKIENVDIYIKNYEPTSDEIRRNTCIIL